MALVKVKQNFQITLPGSLRKKFNISEGDYVDIDEQEDGLLLRPVKVIPKDQAWFWTKEWQKGEAEADKDIAEGKLVGPFFSVSEFIKDLEK